MKIIVPTMTFVSTGHAVIYNRATPVFADVDPDTLNIDLDDVARKITPRTKAIIPVHYGGRPGRYKHIARDCRHDTDRRRCRACLRGRYKGHKCGSLGDLACFSFHAVKNLATGDGGALALNNKAMADRAKRLRWLGIDKGTWDRTDRNHAYLWDYSVNEIGFSHHMNDISAAIGLVQLHKLAKMNQRRREIMQRYNEGLSDLPWVQLPPQDTPDSKSSWHIYHIQVDLAMI